MLATLCFSSLQRLPSLLWMPVAGVNNKAVTWGAAALALQHLWERLRSSYSRWTLLRLEGRRSVPPNPWGCFSSLCSRARVCVKVSHVTRGTVKARGSGFGTTSQHVVTGKNAQMTRPTPPQSRTLSRFVSVVITLLLVCFTAVCLLGICKTTYI